MGALQAFTSLVCPEQWEIVRNVGIAMVLGALPGLEREGFDKPAGLCTHMFVAGAAVLLVGLSDPPAEVPAPSGCDKCHNLGYKGRIGVFHVVRIRAEIGQAICEGRAGRDLRQLIDRQKSHSLLADGLKKVSEGITAMQELALLHRDDNN